jgi:ABC-type transport system involved in cytochrome c biogenesis permease subunit
MDTSIWFWILFNAFILGMLSLDLFFFHSKSHAISIKESLLFSPLLFLSLSFAQQAHTEDSIDTIPVLYQGRFRPLDAVARLWLQDAYHAQSIQESDRSRFHLPTTKAADLMLQMHLHGHTLWDDAPFFWIGQAEVKELLGLNPKTSRFTYEELYNIFKNIFPDPKMQITGLKGVSDEISSLRHSMNEYSSWQGTALPSEEMLKASLDRLQQNNTPPEEVAHTLEAQHPLRQRLLQAGSLIKALPSKFQPGEWFSLLALKVSIYHPQHDRLLPVNNFTLYSDKQFNEIRASYSQWERAPSRENLATLAHQLHLAYNTLAGTPYAKAMGKELTYPTIIQLEIESAYYQYPWIWVIITLYIVACLCFFMALRRAGIALMIAAFGLHTLILAARCFILQRPPVSNMFETVIYVPWIGVLVSFFLKERIAIVSAAVASILLLVMLQITNLNSSLDNVQAVLDSQFWLMIHVMMVVGSYGVFLLSSLLGHLYLASYLYHKGEVPSTHRVATLILQTLYLGTALLITGTILGGVWAAESWGRFWDWDPKESWAFISACVYVIFIHAYRFHKIHHFGLALGAILGFLAISFPWYGVNYILGTGLHSYGFGSGGEGIYYLFITLEAAFIALAGAWSRVSGGNSTLE